MLNLRSFYSIYIYIYLMVDMYVYVASINVLTDGYDYKQQTAQSNVSDIFSS